MELIISLIPECTESVSHSANTVFINHFQFLGTILVVWMRQVRFHISWGYIQLDKDRLNYKIEKKPIKSERYSTLKQIKQNTVIEFDWEMVVTLLLVIKQVLVE